MITTQQIKFRIQEAIKQSGLTQTELAKRLHVSQSTIAHYVKGDIMPSLDSLANLCKIIDVSPAYLLYFSE